MKNYSMLISRINAFIIFSLILFLGCAQKKKMPFEAELYQLKPNKQFPKSDNIFSLERNITRIKKDIANNNTTRTQVLSPNSFRNWTDCLNKTKGVQYIVLKDGDYRSWGVFSPKASGSKDRYQLIIGERNLLESSDDIYQHPFHLAKENKSAMLEAFELKSVSYWIISGITFNGNSNKYAHGAAGLPNSISYDANFNVIDKCYLLDISRGAGILIRTASYNYIQHCVFEQTNHLLAGDNAGILLSAYTNTLSAGNKIVNNELINWNDGIQFLRQVSTTQPQYNKTGDLNGTLIENNDIYLTPDFYTNKGQQQFAFAENAIDIKQGTLSDKEEDKIRIRNNRMWGFRQTASEGKSSGSAGAAIVVHRQAKNVILEKNIIFDVPIGITVQNVNPLFPNEKIERVEIKNNIFYEIKAFTNSKYSGSALYILKPCDIKNNLIHSANKPLSNRFSKTTKYFKDNAIVNNKEAKINALLSDNREFSFGRGTTDFVFHIQQWTNPKKKIIKVPFLNDAKK